jgi:hypothetical protein
LGGPGQRWKERKKMRSCMREEEEKCVREEEEEVVDMGWVLNL